MVPTKIAFVAVSFFALVSPALAQATYDLNSAELAAVRSGVQRGLKDPESAQFGPIKAVIHQDGIFWACGLVNAKNSFGGYIGEKPFVGLLATLRKTGQAEFILKEIGDSEAKSAAIIGFCKGKGIQ